MYFSSDCSNWAFLYTSKHPLHLQDALLFALCYPFSGKDGEAVFADFVHLVAIIFERHLIV